MGGAIRLFEVKEFNNPFERSVGLLLLRCSIVQLESGSLSFRSFRAAASVLILFDGASVSCLRSRILSV